MTRTTLQMRRSWSNLFIMIYVFIISRATLSDSVRDSKPDPNSLCTALEDCIDRCSSTSLTHASCQSESLSCDCRDVKCFVFKGACITQCGGVDSVSTECYDCLVHENLDVCLEACSHSGVCLAADCSNSSKLCEQCLPGYYGVNCQQKCSATCEGSCYRDNGYCGQCETGTFGPNCELTCPLNCYGNNCLVESGHCQRCNSGYRGPTCSNVCASGFYGLNCRKKCSPNCEENLCEYISGNCELGCKPGYFNIRCEQECPSGTYGEDCLAQCPVTCSGGALCDPVNGSCLLGCTVGFQGDLCNVLCPAGRFGENCENNCSDNCFMRACNAFSGHCDRCIWERDGPFCESIKVEAEKERGHFYSELTTDQILLTFLTLFSVGGALWFLMAFSMYHRRKLVWEKIWKTGKVPYRYRLPKSFREFLERSAMTQINKYSSEGREDKELLTSPRRSSPRERSRRLKSVRRKKSLRFQRELQSDSSADTLGEIDQPREFLGGLNLERDSKPMKPEPKDDVTGTAVVGSMEDGLVEVVMENEDYKKETTLENDAHDENLLETVPEDSMKDHIYYAIKHTVSPLPFDVPQIPSRDSQDSLTNFRTENFVGPGSFFSSTPQYSSQPERVSKLLKKTTRTRPGPEEKSAVPQSRQSLSSEGTSTSIHRKSSGWKEEARLTDETETETETDVTSRDTEMENSRNISPGTTSENETETVSREDDISEDATEEASSTASSWTSSVSKITYYKPADLKPIAPKMPINVQQKSPSHVAPPIWTTNLPNAMPHKPPPAPVRPTGILQKSYAYLSSMWPVKIRFAEKQAQKKELPPPVALPQRRYMSYRFMLTRLEEWRRSRGYQHDIRDGVFEVKDEKSRKVSSSAVTEEATITPNEMSGQGETDVQTTSYTKESTETSGIASSTLAALSTWTTSETMTSQPQRVDRAPSGYRVDANSSYRTHRTRHSAKARGQLDSVTTLEASTLRTVPEDSSSTIGNASIMSRSDVYETKSSRPSAYRSVTTTSNDNSCLVYSTTETRSTYRYSKYYTGESNDQTRSSRHSTDHTHTPENAAHGLFEPGRSARGQLGLQERRRRQFNRNSHRQDGRPLGGFSSSVSSSSRARSSSTVTSTVLTTPSSGTPTSRAETSTLTPETDCSLTE